MHGKPDSGEVPEMSLSRTAVLPPLEIAVWPVVMSFLQTLATLALENDRYFSAWTVTLTSMRSTPAASSTRQESGAEPRKVAVSLRTTVS